MNILFVTSEVAPFSKVGGLADVSSALPKALCRLGHRVSVLSPMYPSVKANTGPLSRPLMPLRFKLGNQWWVADLYQHTNRDGVRFMFLDAPALYDRDGVYGTNGVDYPDNGLRFAVLAKAAVVLNIQYDFGFDVLHCHDWPTALVPLYRQTTTDKTGTLNRLATILTVHNLAHQGKISADDTTKISVPKRLITRDALVEDGQLNILKSGLTLADAITTVSPTYAREIRTETYGEGLDGLINRRAGELTGILNGVDYSIWSPDRDPLLETFFDADRQNGKRLCKAAIQAHFGLDIRPRTPIIGVVSRLVHQKGIDILIDALRQLLDGREVQAVIVGTGEAHLEAGCRALAKSFPKQVGVELSFASEELTHRVFAAADLFAVPSRYEPCGLTQMYAMRYGAIPVVRATGGLADTVVDLDPETNHGTGFVFDDADHASLLAALRRGLEVYAKPRKWRQLIATAMGTDFSWARAAIEYTKVYEKSVEKVRER